MFGIVIVVFQPEGRSFSEGGSLAKRSKTK